MHVNVSALLHPSSTVLHGMTVNTNRIGAKRAITPLRLPTRALKSPGELASKMRNPCNCTCARLPVGESLADKTLYIGGRSSRSSSCQHYCVSRGRYCTGSIMQQYAPAPSPNPAILIPRLQRSYRMNSHHPSAEPLRWQHFPATQSFSSSNQQSRQYQ